MYPTPCDHTSGHSLCEACQAEFEADEGAWEEYGHHPRGRANWRRECELMERDRQERAADELPAGAVDLSDIPF